MACIANPWAGRSSGCPRAASSSWASSMTARNPASSSSGSSYPVSPVLDDPVLDDPVLDEIDNLIYRPYQTTWLTSLRGRDHDVHATHHRVGAARFPPGDDRGRGQAGVPARRRR